MNQWSPEQFWPSPAKPVLHVQLNLPLRLLHSAFSLQLWVRAAHSSMSKVTLGKRLWYSFFLELIFYFFWRLSAHFVNCVSRGKRNPTGPNYGPFVEDTTTENNKVVPLFLKTQQTISSNKNVTLITNFFVQSIFSWSFYLDRCYRHP